MIKIENVEVSGWKHAILGMRNPMNSWDKSDSCVKLNCESCKGDRTLSACRCVPFNICYKYMVGEKDHELMMKLRNAGTDHRKYMRMITVYANITAPLYWWKEYDTYKVGTVANSCSTMHRLTHKPFEMSDFSFEHLIGNTEHEYFDGKTYREIEMTPYDTAKVLVDHLNELRNLYLETKNKKVWYAMIQLLPSSYNQRRTVMLNYEVLANMYKSRKNHKLDEWIDFCKWIETLPYSEIITGGNNETANAKNC